MESATESATSWRLVAPDWAEKDTIWHSTLPFVLWPVCDKALLSYWLDEAVRLGVGSVCIEALDRPHLIREWLAKRDLWSRSITVTSQAEADMDGTRLVMDHLPWQDAPTPPTDSLSLLSWWLSLQSEALRQRQQGTVHLDTELSPGVWVGPGAKVASDARLQAPCWIGSYARVESGCRLGPDAFVGSGCFLDKDVEMARSVVCRDSYVGAHTSLENHIVQGGLLIDLERGLAVEVSDPLLLASLDGSYTKPTWWERLAAKVLHPFVRAAARWWNRKTLPSSEEYVVGQNRKVALATYPRGPLLVRRAEWLRAVADGQFRLSGVLPRTAQQWEDLPPEVRSALAQAPVGLLAFSDLHHCHSAGDPDEWMHALYQVSGKSAGAARQLRRSWLRLAIRTPHTL